MEFWGVEVKSGEPLSVKPGDDYIIHLSQACLGEVKKDKGSDSIYLYVEVDGQKLVLGRLSGEKFPQVSFDLMFDKEFQLSHNWKNGSVHFCGFKSHRHESDGDDDDDLDGHDFPEDLPVAGGNNGKSKSPAPIAEKASASKPDSAVGRQKVNIVESKKKNVSSSDDDSDDKDSDSEDQVMASVESESDDEDESEDDDSSDDDEETPKKVEPSKKRPIVDSATKTPAPEKKAKFVTPQKTDGKKGVVHVATPYPSKHVSKASTSTEQIKQQLPSSGGSISCKSCNRTFKSDQALQSHTKAKHSAATCSMVKCRQE